MAVRETVSSSTWCNECSCSLGDENPAAEHNRSRAHINRLLQLGLELPLDDGQLIGESDVEQDGVSEKIAYCLVCETSIGNAVQAAAHYRSREHLNKRLQRGLPVVDVSGNQPTPTPDRDHFNECLRRGVPLSSGMHRPSSGSTFDGIPPAPNDVMRVTNGKRKFPSSVPGPLPKSPPAAAALPIPSFINEKRLCRPLTPPQKPMSFSQKSFTGSSGPSLMHARQAPWISGNGFSSSSNAYYASATNNAYESRPTGGKTFRVPMQSDSSYGLSSPTSNSYGSSSGLYRSHDISAPQPQSFYGSHSAHWNVSDNDHGLSYSGMQGPSSDMNDGWYCDLCNVSLTNAIALSMHTASTEHKMMVRGSHSQVQLSHWT